MIPRVHVASLADTDDTHAVLLGHTMRAVARLDVELGIAAGGYRTVINTGNHGGQTVHHLHVHLLGGRSLSWPPS